MKILCRLLHSLQNYSNFAFGKKQKNFSGRGGLGTEQ
jgi:hypothetical protein